MKKFQKIMSFMLVAAMTMALLAGCSNSSDGASSQDAASENTDTAASDGAATDSDDAAADTSASGASFKIGAIGPATGGAAVYGIAVQNGADLAIKEINAAGGINGYQIANNIQDDECDNEKSVNAYNTL